jgi:4-amino-4-deoxy-L-arabinose transferase-like glycosyltransferase
MNFFKSGTLDDAPLMLLFLLYGLYFLMKSGKKAKGYKYPALTGLFFGLALLTRPAALFPVAGVFLYIVLSKHYRFKEVLLIGFVSLLVLSPWLIRNSVVIGKPVYTNGTGRIFLLLQSEEFIRNFPKESIDVIDKMYFTAHYEKLNYINSLPEKEKDSEFIKLAKEQLLLHPENLWRSMKVKLRVFLPIRYYPHRPGFWKNTLYMLQYIFALIAIIWALVFAVKYGIKSTKIIVLFTALTGYLAIGLIMILLSRHFYPLIVIMFISSGTIFLGIENKANNNLPLNDS